MQLNDYFGLGKCTGSAWPIEVATQVRPDDQPGASPDGSADGDGQAKGEQGRGHLRRALRAGLEKKLPTPALVTLMCRFRNTGHMNFVPDPFLSKIPHLDPLSILWPSKSNQIVEVLSSTFI